MNSTTATPTTTTHSPLPLAVGDLVKLSDWSDDEALQITAVGDIWFLASYRRVGERVYLISSAWVDAVIHFGTDENGVDFAHIERVTS